MRAICPGVVMIALTACLVSVAVEDGDLGRLDLLLEEVPRGQIADLLAHLGLVGGHERLDELPGGIARDAGVVTDNRNAEVRRLAHERDGARFGDRRHDDRVDLAADERRHERRLARGVALRVLTDQVQALRRGADLDALADAAIETLCVEVERAHADALLAAAVTRPPSAARHGPKSQHGDQERAEYESPDRRVRVDPSPLRVACAQVIGWRFMLAGRSTARTIVASMSTANACHGSGGAP